MTTDLSEARLEERFSKGVRREIGGIVVKLAPTVAGLPDRLVILPGGDIRLVELKTRAGRLSPIQKNWHQRAEVLGVHVEVLYGATDIDAWLSAQQERLARTT